MMDRIFFPGSFNPFTRGHADILCRLLVMAEKVTVGIGVNIDKPEAASLSERNARAIRNYLRLNGLENRVEVVVYGGITAEEARKRGASVLARGVRSSQDFDYEYSLSAFNRDAFGIDTILIPADPALSYVSSTAVRDLIKHKHYDEAEKYLPDGILEFIK